MGRLGAIVLAAGGSTRLGRPKQLLFDQGRTLLERVVLTVREAGAEDIVVVLGGVASECRKVLPVNVTAVDNLEWERGMGSSLRLGASTLRKDTTQALIVLCDQPLITAGTMKQLLHRMNKGSAAACVSAFDGTVGPPAAVKSAVLELLRTWSDDRGAKRLWQDPSLQIEALPVPEAAMDVDTEEDVARILGKG
jgi:molybdenum cofactor cytidylyltransferase